MCNRELYQMPTRNPTRHGCLDRRLGVSEKVTGAGTKPLCETCGKGLKHCAGHFGYIKLELPVFHIGFFKATINILQVASLNCQAPHVLKPRAPHPRPSCPSLLPPSEHLQDLFSCAAVGR